MRWMILLLISVSNVLVAALGCLSGQETDRSGSEILAAPISVLETLSVPYGNAFDFILKQSGLNIQMDKLPYKRGRVAFVNGQLHLECCIRPEWRREEEEQTVQLFTKPFYTERQVIVSLKSNNLKITEMNDIQTLPIATVRGFSYKDQAMFGDTIVAENFDHLMMLIANERAQIAIIGLPEFYHQQSLHNNKFQILYEVGSYPLMLRVHKSRADILPVLNYTITRLKSDGTIANLLEGRAEFN